MSYYSQCLLILITVTSHLVASQEFIQSYCLIIKEDIISACGKGASNINSMVLIVTVESHSSPSEDSLRQTSLN